MWGISPNYNYSSGYAPQSSMPYIMVWWNPLWQFEYRYSGATGQWGVLIVNNTNGNYPSFSPYPSPNLGSGWVGWNGIGTGYFQPNPGDFINITVTYNPGTNTLSGVAYDMNTIQSANFTLNLNGYYKPPTSGNYVFGVNAAVDFNYADWALLYVAMTTSIKPTPSALPTLVVVVVLIVAVVVLIIALLMIKRGKR
jgi:hypothetical protein